MTNNSINRQAVRQLKIGTRQSRLALWQTEHIVEKMQQAWPGLNCQVQRFVTQGDKILDKPLPEIGGKGLFTLELENGLHDGSIDLVVHSLKDLPVENPPNLALGAIVGRADVRDVLVANERWSIGTLPTGAKIGTSSLRRQAQLLQHRPDLHVESIRGNVDTRIRKVHSGDYDGAVLAGAGVTRLGLDEHISHWLTCDEMLPAPGQGALAIQCRADDEETLHLLAAIDQADVRAAVQAERTFLHALEGGCSAPVGAYAFWQGEVLHLTGLVSSVDGQQVIRVEGEGRDPDLLGNQLAGQALMAGAKELWIEDS